MVTTCPRCRRSLSSVSAEGGPLFCMYCGQKLGGSSAPAETRTHAYSPQDTSDHSPVPERSGTGTHNTPDDYSSSDYAPAAEPAPSEIGGYKLGRLLGAGGMGAVYEAESPGSGERVAVKLLSSRLAANPSSVERFRQEGRLASQLAHPRCVFVLGADTDNGRPYIVMELMPGRTLKDLVDERGPLSPREAVTRVLDVIDGLAEAHRVGMIHRDVKPSNCFLTPDNRVKVGDFGLSKSLATRGAGLTQTGAFLGTVLFASPEQIRGEPLDYASDVYSVAATLYFLLSGEAPFHHDNAAAALARAISEPPPRIRARRKDVSRRLERVILRGLERDRARRWQTLDDLREALLDLLPERQRPARPRALVAAYVIDRLLLALIAGPVEALRQWLGGAHNVHVELFGIRLVAGVILVAYFALAEGLFGATVGKWLLGLRVARVGETRPPGVPQALLRTLVFHAILAAMYFVPEELVRFFGPGGGIAGGAVFLVCAAALLVQLRKRWGYRGLHDFASGCQATQKPFAVRKLRLAIPHPTPLEVSLPDGPAPLPDAVGGFVVRSRLSEDSNGEQVWLAEDSALGRTVLLWLRPWGSANLPADPARPTRLRRLGGGTLGWAGAGFEWTAFAAPLGGPLAEAIRPGHPLPWADARYLLEQLTEELRAAEADGTLPPRLALDHVWVEPNGRVQVLDFPLCDARYRPHPPLLVLREAASLALEGQPRSGGGPISAPLPAHAVPVLNRLFAEEPPLAEFQRELVETHAHRPEVTPAVRAGHVGVQAAGLAFPLALCFAITAVVGVFAAKLADLLAEQARQAVALAQSHAPHKGGAGARSGDRELEAALAHPRALVRLNDLAARTQADAEARRSALLFFQRRMLEEADATGRMRVSRGLSDEEATREIVLWAGERDESGGRDSKPGGADVGSVLAVMMLFIYGAVILAEVAFAAAFRGGLSMMLAGVAIVRADGRPATRWRCALRAALVWLPVVALLFASALVQAYAPGWMYLAAGLWLAAFALLPVYALTALRYPTRPPQDRVLGTYLVPV